MSFLGGLISALANAANNVVFERTNLVAPPPIGTITLATFPQWDAFDAGADPAVDPSDTVNATEPASAKALYRTHNGYVLRFLSATLAVEHDGFISTSDALRLFVEAATSDVAR